MDELRTYQQARKSRDARFDGTFFVAVKSTGIFCRPICPAPSPKEENVEYFPMAQLAMQAGYRPCLRCRPDSAPHSYAWKGVDTTVERGIRLINQFPDLSLNEIAAKLGINDRYFRDLFNRKLGIGPKQFQLYEKLLYAKQLLHQTSLSIEQIALASGFSSARRLQEALKKSLHLTPSQMRSKQSPPHEKLNIKLAFRPPYHWQYLRDFLSARAIPGMEKVTDTSYERTFSLGKSKGWFKATFHPTDSVFDVQLEISDTRELRRVISQIRRILDLDSDPQVIRQGLIATGIPEQFVAQGLRIPGVWEPFESGCRAILGQQISVHAAIKLVSELAHQLGERKGDMSFFPEPLNIAESDLGFLKMPNSRRQALRTFSQWYADNPHNDNLEEWLQIKGIGPWTVAYAKLRGQSQPDIWLDSDLVIKHQLRKFSLAPDSAKPWRSYLTFQLWSMA